MEEKETIEVKRMAGEDEDKEERILRELIQSHPVLSSLPSHLQQRVGGDTSPGLERVAQHQQEKEKEDDEAWI